MHKRDEVLHFINCFSHTQETFLYGMCYWFSFILNERFGGTTMYLPIENHFVQEIEGRLYDVSGDVTEKYNTSKIMRWQDMEQHDQLLYKRLIRDCVRKEAFDSG